MTEEKGDVPRAPNPVAGGGDGGRASGDEGRAGNIRAIFFAIAALLVLTLCVGAYYFGSPPEPPGEGGVIPVPGHPELSWRPVDAFYENGSRIYVLENSEARDPVYGQMMSMVQDDPSVYGVYAPGHACSSFAVELIENAERCHINAHLVVLTLSNYAYPHAIVAFNTTDRGTVYIDNTGLTQSQIGQDLLVAPRVANVTPGLTYTRQYIGFDVNEDPGWGVVETARFLS